MPQGFVDIEGDRLVVDGKPIILKGESGVVAPGGRTDWQELAWEDGVSQNFLHRGHKQCELQPRPADASEHGELHHWLPGPRARDEA